jgi:small GTP-binding protein
MDVTHNPVVIQKKIALVGAPGVGKTSLVRRFVESVFDDRYLTTIGVKVDKKDVHAGDVPLRLMLWDIAGAEDGFIPSSYIRGAAGYLLVMDGTRPDSLQPALDIVAQIDRDLGVLPAVAILNKCDLADAWCVSPGDLAPINARGTSLVRTSAKTGEGVEEAFLALASRLTT